MSSTFLGLNTAYTGLQASNAALNTTANNVANAETKGYSRQVVSTQAAESIRAFTTFGCVGAGVETLSIERVRDNFYDEKYWNNNSKLGEYSSKKYYMSCIESYYTDDSSIKGFNTIFNEYTKGLSELCKNPNDTTVKQQTIGYAENVTTYFNDMYTNLQKLQNDVNQEIKVFIDRINGIAKEVAALNKQINVIEMNSGAMANQLRDERDLLIDELSEICTVEVEETDVIDMTDTSRDTGGSRYCVKICGQLMVDANDCMSLTCVPRTNFEAVNQTDIDGLYDIYFTGSPNWTVEDYHAKGDKLNLNAGTVSGKLGGLIAMRDGNNGEGFEGTVTDVDEDKQIVTVTVEKDYLKDLTKLDLTTTGGIIKLSNTEYYFSDWTYNYDDATGECTYEFQLDNTLNQTNRVTAFAATQSYEASVGSNIKYQGIPYYMSQMNEWVRKYASTANGIVTKGVLDDGTQGEKLYTGTVAASGEELNFTIPINGTDIEEGEDGGDGYYRIDVSDKLPNLSGITVTASPTMKIMQVLSSDVAAEKMKESKGEVVMLDMESGEILLSKEAYKNIKSNVSFVELSNGIDVLNQDDIKTSDAIQENDGYQTIINGATGEKSYKFKVTNTSDSYYRLTAGNFKVTDTMIKTPEKLATRSSQYTGADLNDIVMKLKDLGTNKDIESGGMNFRGCSADQYLVCMMSDVALNAQRANDFTSNYTVLQSSIENQRLSVSGVDNDEEAVNLTKFQQQYNLASKMIQTLTEVYDRLILQTGV